MDANFNHFDGAGNAIMVDVSPKQPTLRAASARGKIRVSRPVLDAILGHTAAKGDVLGVAPGGRHHGHQAHLRPDPALSSADALPCLGGFHRSGGGRHPGRVHGEALRARPGWRWRR